MGQIQLKKLSDLFRGFDLFPSNVKMLKLNLMIVKCDKLRSTCILY